MIRDTFFDLHRFVSLCRKEMVENWRIYILRSIMVYGIFAIIFIWNGYFQYANMGALTHHRVDPILELEYWMFFLGLIILGGISASFAMERMKTKTSRLLVLMTPATVFEKFFLRWLLATCGFIFVFLIAFKLADWTRAGIYMLAFPDIDVISSFPLWKLCCHSGGCCGDLSGGDSYTALFVSGYFLIQSSFLLGSVIWPKNAFVKTFAALACVLIVYILLAVGITQLFLPADSYVPNPGISEATMRHIVITFNVSLMLFNWVLAYFRFKESEIINRW